MNTKENNISIVTEEQDVAPNLDGMDVPMNEAAPDPDGDYNATPPPLPELYDEAGRQVPYIVTLGVGPKKLRKDPVYEYVDGQKTNNVLGVRHKLDLLCKVVGPFDQRQIDLAGFNTFLRPPVRSFDGLTNPLTDKPKKGKPQSDLVA